MMPGYPRPMADLIDDADAGAVSIEMATPSVALLHVCGAPISGAAVPIPPNNVSMHITPTPGSVIVRWNDDQRCVKTYIVEYNSDSMFSRANPQDTIWRSFVHAAKGACVHCCYRVSTVDYWGTVSKPSKPVCR